MLDNLIFIHLLYFFYNELNTEKVSERMHKNNLNKFLQKRTHFFLPKLKKQRFILVESWENIP